METSENGVEDTVTDTVVMDMIIHKYLADRLCEKLNELNDENEQLKQQEMKLYTYFKKYFDNISEESFKESWELIKDKGDVE